MAVGDPEASDIHPNGGAQAIERARTRGAVAARREMGLERVMASHERLLSPDGEADPSMADQTVSVNLVRIVPGNRYFRIDGKSYYFNRNMPLEELVSEAKNW